MPNLPFVAWVVLGIVPLVICLLMFVETKVIRPSEEEAEREDRDQR